MARYDVDSRRRNAAGQLIGSHNGDAERWYKPMAHGHRTHSDGSPPAQNLRRKHNRMTLTAVVQHQAQPPAPKHQIDAYIITLYGTGKLITYAHDAATALRALSHRDAASAGGVSIHGWIDGTQYSGAMSLDVLRKLLS